VGGRDEKKGHQARYRGDQPEGDDRGGNPGVREVEHSEVQGRAPKTEALRDEQIEGAIPHCKYSGENRDRGDLRGGRRGVARRTPEMRDARRRAVRSSPGDPIITHGARRHDKLRPAVAKLRQER